MKKQLFQSFIMLLILITSIHADENMSCQNGSCSYDPGMDIRNDTDEIDYTKFESVNMDDNLTISVDNNESPRDIRVVLETNLIDSHNVNVNLSSSKDLNNSGEIVLLADSLKNLDLILNGRNGNSADSSSFVCATKILAGDYGSLVRDDFLAARIADTSLPSDQCTNSDLQRITDTHFSCPTDFSESLGSVSSQRWVKRKTCKGQADRKMCVEKKLKISCTWLAQSWTGDCGQTDQKPKGAAASWSYNAGYCNPGVTSGWYANKGDFIKSENYINSERDLGKSDAQICDTLTGRPAPGLMTTSNSNSYRGSFSGSYKWMDKNTYIPSTHTVIDQMFMAAGGFHNQWLNSDSVFDHAEMNNYNSTWTPVTGAWTHSYWTYRYGHEGGGSNPPGGSSRMNDNNGYALGLRWVGYFQAAHAARRAPCEFGYDCNSCGYGLDCDCFIYGPVSWVYDYSYPTYKTTHLSYKVKYRFLDEYGNISFHTIYRKVRHF